MRFKSSENLHLHTKKKVSNVPWYHQEYVPWFLDTLYAKTIHVCHVLLDAPILMLKKVTFVLLRGREMKMHDKESGCVVPSLSHHPHFSFIAFDFFLVS